jgi:transcriptional regulator with XRE-family HTH domain
MKWRVLPGARFFAWKRIKMSKASALTDVFSMMNPGSEDSVGARIRLLRQHRGMTQEEFAKALGGVSRSSVALWETNRGGEANQLPRIAEVLGVSVEFFVNGMSRQDVTETLSVDESVLVKLYRTCVASELLILLRSAGRLSKRTGQPRKPRGLKESK